MNSTVDINECRVTYLWLKWALVVWAIPMLLIILKVVPQGGSVYYYVLGIHIFAALGLFISLGKLAAGSHQNWVHFGVLPALVPIIGPVVSYVLIRRIGRRLGWR